MSCNYPAGMSRADLIHVGAIDDPDEPPTWFEELVNDDWINDTDFLWNEYREYIEAIDHYISAESAAEWLNEYYPSAINEDSRTAA